jgi:hypothetical protein
MWPLVCNECKHKFEITNERFNDFIEDMGTIITCPKCNSIDIKSQVIKWWTMKIPVNFMTCRKTVCTECCYNNPGKICLMKDIFEEEVFN